MVFIKYFLMNDLYILDQKIANFEDDYYFEANITNKSMNIQDKEKFTHYLSTNHRKY
jgi:hypothetical protein